MSCYFNAVTGQWEDSETGRNCNPSGVLNNECYLTSQGWRDYNGNLCNPYGGGGGGGGGTGQNPNIVITGGGATAQTNSLNQVIQGMLSGLAIFRNAAYVPTQVPPQGLFGGGYGGGYGGSGLTPQQLQQLQYDSRGQNFGGSLQQFLQKNTGAVLLIGAGLVLFMMKPPTRRNGVKRNGIKRNRK